MVNRIKKNNMKNKITPTILIGFVFIFGIFAYTPTPNQPTLLEIQKGEVPGHSIMSAFGERDGWGITVTGEDVWRGNELTPSGGTSIPVPSIKGQLMTVVSEDAGDDVGGTGVTSVMVHYLDRLGNEREVLVAMNGTTPVPITTDTMIFVNDFHTESVGSNGVAEGHIKIFNSDTSTLVYNMIAEGGNQSLVCNRMVPNNHTLFLQSWSATEGNGRRSTFRIRSTDKHGHLEPGIFCFKGVSYLNKTASGNLPVYDAIPSFSITKISVWSIVSGGEGSVNYWGILVNNDYL